jgi:hypothetical protein
MPALPTRPWRALLAFGILVAACEVARETGPGSDVTELRIIPDRVATAASQHVRFRVIGRNAAGEPRDVVVTWSSTGGTVDAAGVYEAGEQTGEFQVTATVVGTSVTAAANVSNRGNLKDVFLVPASVTLPPGAELAFDTYGQVANGDSVTVSPAFTATGGSVDADGRFTAGSVPGDYEVIATAVVNRSGKTTSDTAHVTIATGAPVPVSSVDVTPATASVAVNATVPLTATARDAQGNVLTGRLVTWTSDDETIATVDAGLVRGVAAGSTTVRATVEGQSDGAAITVTPPPSGGGQVLVGAGDISDCGNNNDEETAKLLDGIAGTVFTTGDNVYDSGTPTEFQDCYHPTWGRHRDRTRPSPGNHDYNTDGASGYFGYFGDRAGPAGRGYYSYDLGEWHIISLNSEIDMGPGSPQEIWLRQDLGSNRRLCTLAYWHKPRFSSGTRHGNETAAQPLWQALYDSSADVVLAGHEHNYERFAPQTPTGAADPARGIREFVVGTGGRSQYPGNNPLPNSQVFNGNTYGVLKLTLGAGTYTWEFVPVAGETFTDTGSGTCH